VAFGGDARIHPSGGDACLIYTTYMKIHSTLKHWETTRHPCLRHWATFMILAASMVYVR
jgi:hypothetical protein